jgi:hypothetical protein
MRFHAPVSGNEALPWPLMLGHFLPWFTRRGDAFPLSADDARGIDRLPVIDDMRHWRDPGSGYRRSHQHWPEIGVYDSRDPAVIEWQIQTALQYGVQGFIVNWYGKNSVENVITLHWLRGLEAWNQRHPDQPFYYFLSIDSQAGRPGEGRLPVSMEEDFQYIRDHLVREAALRRDGRPVFSVFPYEDNAPAWRQALDAVFGRDGADLIWMNRGPGHGENAAYPWVRPDDGAMDYQAVPAWSQPDNAGDGWLRRFYREASASGVEYLMAGVWPGFNDQLVSWAWNPNPDNPKIRPRVMCRETGRGSTLDLTWQALIDYLERRARRDPDAGKPVPLIQLVTWNDYAETTTLEPTRDYGRGPLETCGAALQRARALCAGT